MGIKNTFVHTLCFSQAQLMLENPCNKNTAATDFSVLHKHKKTAMLKYLFWQTLGIRVQQLCFRAVEPRSKYKCILVHCFAVQLLLLCYSHCHFRRLVAPVSTQLGAKDVLLHYCRLKLQPGQTSMKVNVTQAARIYRLGFGHLTHTLFASNLRQLQKRHLAIFLCFF